MTASPFKFLDSFDRGDRSIFFGRDAEIEALYRLLFESGLVLVYGQSGTGKTSLIRCGLANRFAETDWFELFVRRNDDLNKSLAREIRAKATTQIADDKSPVEAIRSLYLDHLRPIYLIFDQFEELFILGSKDEQQQFFATVAAILASDVSCKIIISLREEYLGSLYPFEPVVPTLFNKRLRVEPMSMTNIEQVITGMTGALGIKLENGVETARKIIGQLDDGRNGIQLAYLQVYLDHLYQHAAPRGEPVTFTDQDVDEAGKLGDLMAGYLQTQKAEIENDLKSKRPGLPTDAIQHLLEAFVSVDGTKQPTTHDQLLQEMPESASWLDDALAALENARILRATDQSIELAHDALAKRIADSRSADRLAMLNVERLVRDALFHHQQQRSSYLSRKDLKTVDGAQKLSKAGVATLDLSPEERDFVRKSRIRFWVGRVSIIAIFTALMTAALVLGLGLGGDDDDAIKATSEVDDALYGAYSAITDNPNEADVRKELLEEEKKINTERDESIFRNDDHFWDELYATDSKVEEQIKQNPNANVSSMYKPLEQKLWTKYGTDLASLDLRARVQLKAVLWREGNWSFYNGDNEGQTVKLAKSLLDVTETQEGDPTPSIFEDAIARACVNLQTSNATDSRCHD